MIDRHGQNRCGGERRNTGCCDRLRVVSGLEPRRRRFIFSGLIQSKVRSIDAVFLISMSAAPRFDARFIDRLRGGDEEAFSNLLDAYHGPLFRLAMSLGASEASAEEIVQETWVAVIDGLDAFEERSSLKTWIFSILTNQARRRTKRDARMPPLSSVFSDQAIKDVVENQENPCPRSAPTRSYSWSINPSDRTMQRALLEVVQEAIDDLPTSQRTVVILRDFEGLEPQEVCEILDISDGNHRVLLHRGRIAIREAVNAYFAQHEDEETP